MPSIVRVPDATAATQALACTDVLGVIYSKPLVNDTLNSWLSSHRVQVASTLGPLVLGFGCTFEQQPQLKKELCCRTFAIKDDQKRDALIEEILHTFDFFAEILGEKFRFEGRARFLTRKDMKSRPHYDPSKVNMVRTLAGAGTWVHPPDETPFQIAPLDCLVFKGRTLPRSAGEPALLHDYPNFDDPQATDLGRIVAIARSKD